MSKGSWDQVSQLEAEVRRNPGSPLFAKLADAYSRRGRFNAAIQVSVQGLKLHPKLLAGHIALARALFGAGRLLPATRVLAAATRFEDCGPEPYRLLGEVLLRRGLSTEAAAIVNHALRRGIRSRSLEGVLTRAKQSGDDGLVTQVRAVPDAHRGIGNVAVAGTIGKTDELEVPSSILELSEPGDITTVMRQEEAFSVGKTVPDARVPDWGDAATGPGASRDGRDAQPGANQRVGAATTPPAEWSAVDDGWEKELATQDGSSYSDVGSDVLWPFGAAEGLPLPALELAEPPVEGMPPLPLRNSSPEVAPAGRSGAGPAVRKNRDSTPDGSVDEEPTCETPIPELVPTRLPGRSIPSGRAVAAAELAEGERAAGPPPARRGANDVGQVPAPPAMERPPEVASSRASAHVENAAQAGGPAARVESRLQRSGRKNNDRTKLGRAPAPPVPPPTLKNGEAADPGSSASNLLALAMGSDSGESPESTPRESVPRKRSTPEPLPQADHRDGQTHPDRRRLDAPEGELARDLPSEDAQRDDMVEFLGDEGSTPSLLEVIETGDESTVDKRRHGNGLLHLKMGSTAAPAIGLGISALRARARGEHPDHRAGRAATPTATHDTEPSWTGDGREVSPVRRSGGSRARRWLFVLFVLALGGGGGYGYWTYRTIMKELGRRGQEFDHAWRSSAATGLLQNLRALDDFSPVAKRFPHWRALRQTIVALLWLDHGIGAPDSARAAGGEASGTTQSGPAGPGTAPGARAFESCVGAERWLALDSAHRFTRELKSVGAACQPNFLGAWLRARALWLAGDEERAAQQLEALHRQSADLSVAALWLGHLQRESGELEQAERSYRAALGNGEGPANAALGLATVLFAKEGSTAEAAQLTKARCDTPYACAWRDLLVAMDEPKVLPAVRDVQLARRDALRRAVARLPRHGELLWLGVSALIRSGDFVEAERLSQALLEVRPRRAPAVAQLIGELRFAQGLPSQAIEAFSWAAPRSSGQRRQRALAFLFEGRTREAAEALDAADRSAEALAIQATIAIHGGAAASPRPAIARVSATVGPGRTGVDQLRELAEHSPLAALLLSRLPAEQAPADQVQRGLELAQSSRALTHMARHAAAQLALARGELVAACRLAHAVASDYPAYFPGVALLGEVELALGNCAEAVKQLNLAERAGYGSGTSLLSLATAQLMLGQVKPAEETRVRAKGAGASPGALAALEQVIRRPRASEASAKATGDGAVPETILDRFPGHPLRALKEAERALRARDPVALKWFEQARILDDAKECTSPRILARLALVRAELANLDGESLQTVQALLDRAIQADASFADPHCRRGELLFDARNVKDARAALRRCLELDPMNADALFLVGTGLRAPRAESRDALKRFLVREPRGPRAMVARRAMRRLK